MNKEVISIKQMQLLIFIYSIGAYLLFNLGAKVKQDAWISSILAVIFSIPIVIMYGKLMSLYPGKNFFDVLEIVFGKVIGKVLNIIAIFNTFFLGAYILNNFTDFIKVTALFNTPIFIIMVVLGILSIWILNAGIEVLVSWAHFLIRITLIFIGLMWILLIPEMHIKNLLPIFYSGFKNISKEGFSLMIFPFTEVFLFINFFDYLDCDKKNISKNINVFIKPLIIGGIVCISATIINIMFLGGETYSEFYYPGYESIKRLKFSGEFQRLEIIVSANFAIVQFLRINFCLLGVSKGITKVFNLQDYRNILVPVVLLFINFSFIMFKSIMEAMEFTSNLWPFYGFLMQILFPGIIFIVALIKKKSLKN